MIIDILTKRSYWNGWPIQDKKRNLKVQIITHN